MWDVFGEVAEACVRRSPAFWPFETALKATFIHPGIRIFDLNSVLKDPTAFLRNDRFVLAFIRHLQKRFKFKCIKRNV